MFKNIGWSLVAAFAWFGLYDFLNIMGVWYRIQVYGGLAQ